MRPTTLLLLSLLAVAPVAHAADPALEAKLKEAKLEYVIDGDGDYKIVYEWSQDQRSQVVFISGQPEGLEGVRLYSVLLLNDDYTPMDFVVDVLLQFFPLNLEQATQVMLHVHTRGRGVCGVFTREVAESKVAQVNEYARLNQHPLLCTMEKA